MIHRFEWKGLSVGKFDTSELGPWALKEDNELEPFILTDADESPIVLMVRTGIYWVMIERKSASQYLTYRTQPMDSIRIAVRSMTLHMPYITTLQKFNLRALVSEDCTKRGSRVNLGDVVSILDVAPGFVPGARIVDGGLLWPIEELWAYERFLTFGTELGIPPYHNYLVFRNLEDFALGLYDGIVGGF